MQVNVNDPDRQTSGRVHNDEDDQPSTEAAMQKALAADQIDLDQKETKLASVHFDHVYTTLDIRQTEKKVSKYNSQSPGIMVTSVANKNTLTGSGNLLFPLWPLSSASLTKTNKTLPMSYSTDFNSRGRRKNGDPEISSLNAETIQEVFQNMINMTSLAPMQDLDQFIGSSTTDSGTENATKTTTEPENTCEMTKTAEKRDDKQSKQSATKKTKVGTKNIERTPKKGKKITACGQAVYATKGKKSHDAPCGKSQSVSSVQQTFREVDKDEWTATTRSCTAVNEFNTILRFTADLLVRRWRQYLSMTSEEIHRIQLDLAKESGMTDEVLELLESKDTCAWSLIEELDFFQF